MALRDTLFSVDRCSALHDITRTRNGRCQLQNKLTIIVDEAVYDGLYRVVGPRRISQFIEELVRMPPICI